MTEIKPSPSPLPEGQFSLTSNQRSSSSEHANPTKSEPEPKQTFRLHINDLGHPAASQFLSLVDGATVFPNALSAIRTHLYPSISSPGPSKVNRPHPLFQLPPTRSVTTILRPMDGVAYTTGIDLDPDHHKEIHVNMNYIRDCTNSPSRRRDEIIGVITHEMVHCYQYAGYGTAPGGLIEGIADFVRLRANLGPPHWVNEKGERERGKKWDDGYQKTAFFLDWLEEKYGKGTVGRINATLRTRRYHESEEETVEDGKKRKQLGFWAELFGDGVTIDKLWDDYCKAVDGEGYGEVEGAPPPPVPTCAVKDEGGEDKPSSDSDDIVVVERE